MTYSDFHSTPDDLFKENYLGRYLWGFPKLVDAAFNSTLAEIWKKKKEEREKEQAGLEKGGFEDSGLGMTEAENEKREIVVEDQSSNVMDVASTSYTQYADDAHKSLTGNSGSAELLTNHAGGS